MCLSFAFAQDYPLEQVSAGQTGYALTAGAGNVIERFPIEIIALQNDVGVGFPLILIKASGDFIEEAGGVAAGMSGSPVYLPLAGEDALVGAIGYVFPSSDHALALVTPIAVMRDVLEAQTESYLDILPFNEAAFEGLGEAQPVSTPILMSGSSPRVLKQLEPLFGERISPYAAQVTPLGTADESEYSLEPGSAVSVQLVRGDVTVAGVGTLTEINDDQVLAFGHPFLSEGAVDFALTPAFVSYIVPSDVTSFKLADNGKTLLGSISQDRPAALAGTLGQTPDFLPVSLTLISEEETINKRFEVSNDERFYAPLLAGAVLQIFDEAAQRVGEGSVNMAWDIELADGERVRVLEQVTDANDISLITSQLAAAPLAILADNIFATPDIENVSLNVEYSPEQTFAELVEVVLENDEPEEGDLITLHLRLQPYRGDPVVRSLRFNIPEDAEGSFDISIRGGNEASPSEPGEDDAGDPILSYGELLVALRDNVQGSELVVEADIDGERERLEVLSFPYPIVGEETVTVTLPEEDGEGAEGLESTDTTEDAQSADEED